MHTDRIYSAYLDLAGIIGQVVKMGSDSEHVTPVTAITDIPYGVLGPGGEAQALEAGDFADVAVEGELPCIAGVGGVTAGGWVVASVNARVIDVPDDLAEETTIITTGIAKDDALEGEEVEVFICRVALTIPAGS
jgi:hypothetical protein